jgi:pyruvate formate lyase activating enzyme
MPVEDVYDYAIQDRAFYRRSGGGVTLSGGEPLYQFDFSLALSAYFRSKGISVVVETTGYSPWEKIKALAEHADMFLYDIKHMDPEMHLEYTGVGNEVILENIIKLEKMGVPIKPRVPLIPGINDDHDNLSRTASFIARNLHSVKSVGLLPYHRLGLPKYQQLARHCDVSMVLPVSRSQWRYYDRVATVFASQGLRYTIGS